MKEHPILYSVDMVKAKLTGKKTMTRRVTNPQPVIDEDSGFVFDGKYSRQYDQHNWKERFIDDFSKWMPGDIMWTRESFANYQTDSGFDIPGTYRFKTDKDITDDVKFKPSIHMPKEAARIWDEVINIKVERVADISEEDAIKEGVQSSVCSVTGVCYKDYLVDASEYGHPDHDFPWARDARHSYQTLWDKLNREPKFAKRNGVYVTYPFDEKSAEQFAGKKRWKGKQLVVITNPWVWSIEYKVLSTTGKPS